MKFPCISLIALWFLMVLPGEAKVFFKCSPRLDKAYGICSHITRRNADFPLREQDLREAKKLGIDWVRSDYDWYTAMKNNDKDFEPAVFDSVWLSCQNHRISFLPILDRGYRQHLAWEDSTSYLRYVSLLTNHLRGRIKYWEVINEANLIGSTSRAQLGRNYAKTLASVYRTIKGIDSSAIVVYGGQGEVRDSFLSSAWDAGAYAACDVMNFHSYDDPENLFESFQKIASVMKKHKSEKPVWLTETGYSTVGEGTNHKDFFLDVVPEALRRIGVKPQKATIGIVYAPEEHIPAPTEDQLLYFSQFKNVKMLSLGDLLQLNPEKIQVLLPSYGEYFPQEYGQKLVDYVKRGGTLICPQGVPFYFNHYEHGEYTQRGASLSTALHLAYQFWWSEEAKYLNVPEVPQWYRPAQDMPFSYSWSFSKNNSSRFISDAALQAGDKMTPLVEAGNEEYTGCVAALLELNSDLKGNIIIQTRIDRETRNEIEQAKRVARAYLIAFSAGVEKVFWYHLRSYETTEGDPESYFGIVHRDFSEKPAYYAYQTLTRMCPNGSTRPKLDVQGEDYRAQWQQPDGTWVTALWTTGLQHNVKIENQRIHAAFNHLGEPIKLRHWQLKIGRGVVYLLSQKSL